MLSWFSVWYASWPIPTQPRAFLEMRAQERKRVFVSFLPRTHFAASQCRSRVKEQCPAFSIITQPGKVRPWFSILRLCCCLDLQKASIVALDIFIYWGDFMIKESFCTEILFEKQAFVLFWESKPSWLARCRCFCTSMPLFFSANGCG